MHALPSELTPHFVPEVTLKGSCGYQIQDQSIHISIAEIANQRDLSNISGTLAVELWALTAPYNGGDFQGMPLAGTEIGTLFGQHFLANNFYTLNFSAPGAGTWYLTLMLREWTETGFVTQDYINFATPYLVEPEKRLDYSEQDNVINVDFTDSKQHRPVSSKTRNKPAKKSKTALAAEAASAKVISVNHAQVNEIAAVKGISEKLAHNIVATRPFESLDALLKVKGMGVKLLEKIRQFISL